MPRKTKSPLKDLFRGDNFRCLAQVFLVMSGVWFTLNAVTSILPGVLLTVRHVNSMVVTNAQLVANLLLAICFVPFGMLGQKIGRRTILAVMGLAGMYRRAHPVLRARPVGLPERLAADPAGELNQSVRDAGMGNRHLVYQRAFPHCGQGFRLWHRLQRGGDHSRIFLLLYAGPEGIGNALRIH